MFLRGILLHGVNCFSAPSFKDNYLLQRMGVSEPWESLMHCSQYDIRVCRRTDLEDHVHFVDMVTVNAHVYACHKTGL